MERILPLIIIGIIYSIVNAIKKSNGQGKGSGAPQTRQPAMRANAAQPAAPKVSPAPVSRTPAPAAPAEPAPVARDLPESDRMPAFVDEGDSRECEHGSVGGSMDIESHEGMKDGFEHATTKVKTQVKTQVKVNVKTRESDDANDRAPLKSARGVDRKKLMEAVVMAEVLKRPSERRFRYR
ncbi:MAG: hypothetical protein IJJ23_05620 [Clostridia bacterium]|nr:hypothetical protein [Clostridia bacterium]